MSALQHNLGHAGHKQAMTCRSSPFAFFHVHSSPHGQRLSHHRS